MFQGWDNVFMLTGTASGSLIGLLFVVVTLTGSLDRSRALRAAGVYLTPNIVHFAMVLTCSVAAEAPHVTGQVMAIIVAVAAALGLANAVRTWFGILAFAREGNPPHWSDIWTYGGLPGALYIVLALVAWAIWSNAPFAPTAMAVVLTILLLVAIRNAWDLITWMVPRRDEPPTGDANGPTAGGAR